LAKDPALDGELRATLADAMAVLELVLQEVECVIPTTAQAGLRQLGLEGSVEARAKDWPQWPSGLTGRPLGKIEPLFPLLEEEKTKG
jgi:methionyl-tRNA synthetase